MGTQSNRADVKKLARASTMALLLTLAASVSLAPQASADDRQDERHDDRRHDQGRYQGDEHENHGRPPPVYHGRAHDEDWRARDRDARDRDYRERDYRGPSVGYAPPPVYYGQPPGISLNLLFPFAR